MNGLLSLRFSSKKLCSKQKSRIKIELIAMLLTLNLGTPTHSAERRLAEQWFHETIYDEAQSTLKYALFGAGILLLPTGYTLARLSHQKRLRDREKRALHAFHQQTLVEHSAVQEISQLIALSASRPLDKKPVSRKSLQKEHPAQAQEDFANDVGDILLPFMQRIPNIPQRDGVIEAEYQKGKTSLVPSATWERPWNWLYTIYSPNVTEGVNPLLALIDPILVAGPISIGMAHGGLINIFHDETLFAMRHNPKLYMTFSDKKIFHAFSALGFTVVVGALFAHYIYFSNKWEQSATRTELQMRLQAEIASQAVEPAEEPARDLAEAAVANISEKMFMKIGICGAIGLGFTAAALSSGLMFYSKYAAQR